MLNTLLVTNHQGRVFNINFNDAKKLEAIYINLYNRGNEEKKKMMIVGVVHNVWGIIIY